jgi:hypothetical protein
MPDAGSYGKSICHAPGVKPADRGTDSDVVKGRVPAGERKPYRMKMALILLRRILGIKRKEIFIVYKKGSEKSVFKNSAGVPVGNHLLGTQLYKIPFFVLPCSFPFNDIRDPSLGKIYVVLGCFFFRYMVYRYAGCQNGDTYAVTSVIPFQRVFDDRFYEFFYLFLLVVRYRSRAAQQPREGDGGQRENYRNNYFFHQERGCDVPATARLRRDEPVRR